jgi:hypothetical protein
VLLKDRLWVYSNSAEAAALQAGYQAAADELTQAAGDTAAQCFVATATWGLDMWERYLLLPTTVGLSDDRRRERIISKLRGAGISTRALIERVAEAYSNGECEVTEQFAGYTFTVRFISERGRPPGLELLQAAIEEIKPAHLAVVYVFLYTTHDELRPFTHDQLAAYTHEEIRTLTV